ncbi:MAG: serine acetyltransferase [Rubrivivax sp.]
MSDPDWRADRLRYDAGAAVFLREQSLWALWVYRFGRRVKALPAGPRRRLWQGVYRLLHTVVETATGITLPQDACIGPGLRIWHFGCIVVHPQVVIGVRCTLRHGVTLGVREHGGPCPVLEDEVELGAHAQVLGGVRLGRGCRIGAMALVLQDVPAGATAVGQPARVIDAGAPPPPTARLRALQKEEA